MHARTPAVARPGRAAAVILLTALLLTTVVGRTQPAHGVDPGVEVVYVANGRDFADALVGAVIAAMHNTSVLTVAGTNNGDFVPDATKSELTRLKPKQVVVLGGPAAVSSDVFEEVGTFTDPPGNATRLFGDDRFATASAISAALPDAIKRALFADEAGDAQTLDGMDASAFAIAGHDHDADYLAIGGKAADADRLDGLDSSAFVRSDDLRRVPLLPGDAVVSGVANLVGGTSAGIELQEGGEGSFGLFGWTVELPPNYTPGSELTAALRYTSEAGGCTFDMSLDADSAWGPAGTARKDPATTVPGSVDGTGSLNTIGQFTVTIGGDLEPGDLLWLGLARIPDASDDTCAGPMYVHGGTLTFS